MNLSATSVLVDADIIFSAVTVPSICCWYYVKMMKTSSKIAHFCIWIVVNIKFNLFVEKMEKNP